MDYNKYMMKLKKSNSVGCAVFAWIVFVGGCLGFGVALLVISDATTVLHEIEAFLIVIGSVICTCSGVFILILCKIHDVLYYKKSYEEYVFYTDSVNGTNSSQNAAQNTSYQYNYNSNTSQLNNPN